LRHGFKSAARHQLIVTNLPAYIGWQEVKDVFKEYGMLEPGWCLFRRHSQVLTLHLSVWVRARVLLWMDVAHVWLDWCRCVQPRQHDQGKRRRDRRCSGANGFRRRRKACPAISARKYVVWPHAASQVAHVVLRWEREGHHAPAQQATLPNTKKSAIPCSASGNCLSHSFLTTRNVRHHRPPFPLRPSRRPLTGFLKAMGPHPPPLRQTRMPCPPCPLSPCPHPHRH